MSYATRADMVKRFGEAEIIQLAEDNRRLAAALADAASLIHGYLARRYSLPLKPAPALAKRWACDLARWFLQPHSAPEQVKDNYQRTLAELKEAAEGELDLGAETLEGPWSGAVEFSGPGRVFGEIKGF